MAYDDRKTTSLVRLNSKISAINLLKLEFGAVDVPEGRFVRKNAAGKAVLATGTDTFVLLNFLDTVSGTVKTSTKDNFDTTAPTLTQSSGGLSGIVGNGVPIGLPIANWDPARSPVLGDWVGVGASGAPLALDPAGPPAPGTPLFGTVFEVSLGIAWFIFESMATLHP